LREILEPFLALNLVHTLFGGGLAFTPIGGSIIVLPLAESPVDTAIVAIVIFATYRAKELPLLTLIFSDDIRQRPHHHVPGIKVKTCLHALVEQVREFITQTFWCCALAVHLGIKRY
jgi:hypothetical protein